MLTSDEDREPVSSSIYDLDSSDPKGRLVDRSALTPATIHEVSEVMAALGRLREAEQELSDASLKYMKLNQSDMRALHYLIVSGNRGVVATPGGIAAHLKISSASTTKLLDRLERAGHITRAPHPTDRRSLSISITPTTHEVAKNTVGRQQAKRFHAGARLTTVERKIVIKFLDDMTSEISISDAPWAHATTGAGKAPASE